MKRDRYFGCNRLLRADGIVLPPVEFAANATVGTVGRAIIPLRETMDWAASSLHRRLSVKGD